MRPLSSRARAIAVAGALAPMVAGAAPPPESEMVRPDGKLPPETEPTPMVAVTPPDLLPPVVPAHVWRAQQRKLKIQTGVSWAVAAVGLIGVAVPVGIFAACGPELPGTRVRDCPERRGLIVTLPIFGAIALAGLIPAVIFSDRLRYQRAPERAPNFGVSPGGLVLRF